MMELEDGKGVWQKNIGLPWNEYKLLQRDKFEELVQCMVDAYPEHELTEWLKRGFCMNEGDSTISFSSLEGYKMLQWGINHFDREDADSYNSFYGEEEEIDWDDDDW